MAKPHGRFLLFTLGPPTNIWKGNRGAALTFSVPGYWWGTQMSTYPHRILCRMRYHRKMAPDIDWYNPAILRILQRTNREHARWGECSFKSEESHQESTSVPVSGRVAGGTVDWWHPLSLRHIYYPRTLFSSDVRISALCKGHHCG